MKSSDGYLRAAELLITGHPRWGIFGFSCLAIEAAQGDLRGRYGEGFEVDAYEHFFMPLGTARCAWGDLWSESQDERLACRVLALLFMYQLALDEEAA